MWHHPLWRDPHRQQVIVFRAPLPGNPDYIKRVIAIPGDLFEVRGGAVYINGQPLSEPYRLGVPNGIDSYGPVRIPPGKYFAMGDNRDDSYDSRYWGYVPRENILGTPLFIYMSIDAPEEVWEPGHLGERMATYLSIFIHPREVRWSRLFRPI
jgi:signal peptidase I